MEENALQQIAEDNIRVNALLNASIHDLAEQTAGAGDALQTRMDANAARLESALNQQSALVRQSAAGISEELHVSEAALQDRAEERATAQMQKLEALSQAVSGGFSQMQNSLIVGVNGIIKALSGARDQLAGQMDTIESARKASEKENLLLTERANSQLQKQNRVNSALIIVALAVGLVNFALLLVLLFTRN